MTRAVAKKANTQVGNFDYGEMAGAGFEQTTSSDLSIPFISILQSNSPQIENNDPEGAKSGQLFNTVTRQLIDGDEGIVFLPCHKEMAFVEWVPRNKGGGFVGLHAPESAEVRRAVENNNGSRIGRLEIGDNELIETHYMYGLILDAKGNTPEGFAVVSFTSTKIKPHRDWITSMYTLKGRPPMFACRSRIRTIKQKNEHGTFHNFRIDPFGDNWMQSLIPPKEGAELLEEAVSFRDMVQSGMARAAFETQDATVGSGEEATTGDEDIPF